MKCKNCRNLVHKESDFRFPWCPIFDDCFDIEAERICTSFEPQSNADKIRNMTDEELAEFINMVANDSMDTISYGIKDYKEVWEDKEPTLQWLKSEAKE